MKKEKKSGMKRTGMKKDTAEKYRNKILKLFIIEYKNLLITSVLNSIELNSLVCKTHKHIKRR